MAYKKINGEDFPQDKVLGLIALMNSNPIKSALFVKEFEDIVKSGWDLEPDCNVWYRVKPSVLQEIDELDVSEKEKEALKAKVATIVGCPVFYVGKRTEGDEILTAGMVEGRVLGFNKKHFRKIESDVYSKNLKKVLLVSENWNTFIKLLIWVIRGFELDDCSSFPTIVAPKLCDEED